MIPLLITAETDGAVSDPGLLQGFQTVSLRWGCRPTWLIGPRTLMRPRIVETLLRWKVEGHAELGTHLDILNTPPLVDWPDPLLPISLLREKLVFLTESFVKAIGSKPSSLRSHPAFVDDRMYVLLASMGYKVDLTVAPHRKNALADFTAFSEKPYLTPQNILEVPKTVRMRKKPGEEAFWDRFFPPTIELRLQKRNLRTNLHLLDVASRSDFPVVVLNVRMEDWKRGGALLRDLSRVLSKTKENFESQTSEEFHQKFRIKKDNP